MTPKDAQPVLRKKYKNEVAEREAILEVYKAALGSALGMV